MPWAPLREQPSQGVGCAVGHFKLVDVPRSCLWLGGLGVRLRNVTKEAMLARFDRRWLRQAGLLQPFIESVDRDEATSLLEWSSPYRLVQNGLSPGIGGRKRFVLIPSKDTPS
jgi:hypothetical protein